MRPALLDVGVLIALLDTRHVHHQLAAAWLRNNIAGGWATCAITQNGFVRVVSQPSYPNPVPTAQALAVLRRATKDADHQYWPCDLQLVDTGGIDGDYLLGPKQVTDAYLLAIATARRSRFVTFDQRVSLAAAIGATPSNLTVVRGGTEITE